MSRPELVTTIISIVLSIISAASGYLSKRNAKAKYTYDYADGNEFTISRVETYDFDLVPGVIEFAGKSPPDDVGFISGHFELIEAIKAGKNATEEQIEMREHYI